MMSETRSSVQTGLSALLHARSIALVGINVLALIYDSQYVPFALGVDALVVGVEIKSAFAK